MQRDSALLENFGNALRQLRIEKGFSQENLAMEAGLDRTYISMLERGIRQPSLSSLFALASALGVRASRIVRLTEQAALKS